MLLCALVALASETAYGLGLGKLELRSALNQQFDAEIELTGIGGLENDEIIPSLASPADFQRVGIERAHLLTDLRFSVVATPNGGKALKVTSTRPVVEPFLNFLVEVLWPSGRILREYTVLLDPPVFGEAGIRPIEAPITDVAPQRGTAATSPRQTQTPAQTPRPTTAARPTGRLDEGTASDGEYGVTGPGDTLWAIAAKVRPDNSVTVQQTMLAIQRANPRAFINNNINLLKAGHVLRIPDRAEIAEEAVASAVREVRVQNEEFEAYRGGQTQLDASRRQPAERTDGSGSADQGELRLVASDRATAGERAGTGNDPRAEELSNSLSVAQEDLDRARRANSEMNLRLDDLSGQIETLNEIVKLKDDQLAALRAELQRVQAAGDAAPAAAPSRTESSEGSLLTNPFVLGALVLLGIGGAAAALYMRNRKQPRADEEEAFDAIDIEEHPVTAAVVPIAAAAAVEEDEEELSPQTSDVVGEAEIYIAYGRFPQAITFLQNAIEAEPHRADIQLKLLEVYVQTEDATAFNLQLEQLRSLGDDAATAQALKLQKKIPGAAEAAAVAMGATIVSSEPIMAIDEPEEDDLTFDLDDLDAETEEDALTLSSDELDDADGLDLDLDLDLEADSSEEDLELSADGLELVSSDAEEDEETIVLDSPLDGLDDEDLDTDLENLADADASAEDDDAITLDLDEEEDALTFDNDTIELNLDDDDVMDLSLEDTDDAELDLNANDDTIELNLDDDDALELDLADEAELDLSDDALDLDDDDLMLDLDEDASTKLELARAYIDMGDSDGARNVLQEVLQEGSDSEVQEANELLEKIT